MNPIGAVFAEDFAEIYSYKYTSKCTVSRLMMARRGVHTLLLALLWTTFSGSTLGNHLHKARIRVKSESKRHDSNSICLFTISHPSNTILLPTIFLFLMSLLVSVWISALLSDSVELCRWDVSVQECSVWPDTFCLNTNLQVHIDYTVKCSFLNMRYFSFVFIYLF